MLLVVVVVVVVTYNATVIHTRLETIHHRGLVILLFVHRLMKFRRL